MERPPSRTATITWIRRNEPTDIDMEMIGSSHMGPALRGSKGSDLALKAFLEFVMVCELFDALRVVCKRLTDFVTFRNRN
jgi:hypothetical protein